MQTTAHLVRLDLVIPTPSMSIVISHVATVFRIDIVTMQLGKRVGWDYAAILSYTFIVMINTHATTVQLLHLLIIYYLLRLIILLVQILLTYYTSVYVCMHV